MRRKVGLFLVFGAVLPLIAASAAWACGVLAVLKLDTKVASPGQAVTATGKNYSAAAGASLVTISLKSRTGQVLATTPADSAGKINQTMFLPQSISPGWYVVIATQFNANGTPKSGTPGRTSLRIQGTASRSRAEASPWAAAPPAGSGGPSSPVAAGDGSGSGSQSVLTMLLAAFASLGMLGLGWALLGRRTRTLTGPQLGV